MQPDRSEIPIQIQAHVAREPAPARGQETSTPRAPQGRTGSDEAIDPEGHAPIATSTMLALPIASLWTREDRTRTRERSAAIATRMSLMTASADTAGKGRRCEISELPARSVVLRTNETEPDAVTPIDRVAVQVRRA